LAWFGILVPAVTLVALVTLVIKIRSQGKNCHFGCFGSCGHSGHQNQRPSEKYCEKFLKNMADILKSDWSFGW